MSKSGPGRPDFPYYNGVPCAITAPGWAAIMVSVVMAFAALSLLPFRTLPMVLLPKLLFAGLPLAALIGVAGRQWTALFKPLRLSDVGIILLTAVGALVASALGAVLINILSATVPNPIVTQIATLSTAEFVQTLLPTAPQLVGEELLTLLPFLAVLWFATQRLKLGRQAAIGLALLSSTLLFAAAHLPTYNWHLAQCFGVIGTARVVLTLSYIWTRNIWVPVGAHILNDWAEFIFIFSFGHVPINAA